MSARVQSYTHAYANMHEGKAARENVVLKKRVILEHAQLDDVRSLMCTSSVRF